MSSLRESWDAESGQWIAWARASGHDSYWHFHRDALFSLLPPPGRLTLDVGCGEGRVTRDLAARGHSVIGLDASTTMATAAANASGGAPFVVADAAHLPIAGGAADLAVAFMCLQDVDDWESAIEESARCLEAGGRLHMAIVHPINAAGRFTNEDVGAPFVIEGSYYERVRIADRVERDGLEMTFHSQHRTLDDYSRALERAGYVIEAIREPTETDPTHRFFRIPLFLHVIARRDR